MEEQDRDSGGVTMTQATEQARVHDDNVWYRTARNTAVAGGVCSAVFTSLLVATLIGSAVIGPWRENKLAAMKLRVQKEPASQQLVSQVRQLDLKIRRDRIWRLDFAHKAIHMLLGSVVILVVAGALASKMKRQLPRPQHLPDAGEMQRKEAKRARLAVLGGVTVLVVGGLLVALTGWVRFAQAEDAGPAFASAEEMRQQWPRFRGPGGAGISAYANIPGQWNGKTGEGVLWKSKVPLPGRNSPVVWKDRIFLAGADPNTREVYCFDAANGQLLWSGDVPTAPLPKDKELNVMEDTGYAPSTVATDGRRVYAVFPTGDVAGFDFQGRRLWHRNLGLPDNSYGYASSLETYEKLVLIQFDQGDGSEGKSRFIALDGQSGKVAWQARRETPNSWTTPIVIDVAGKPQLITVAKPFVISYNPANGAELWRAECVGGDAAPSPIYAGGLIIVIEPYAQAVAVRPTGQGNVTKTHVVWHMEDSGPDICSPVSDGKYVYTLESGGLLLCTGLEDGKKAYEADVREECRASPGIVGDKLYLLDMKGIMHIAQTGPEFKEIARCELGEECFASPAFADGRICLRGAENLYYIGKTP
ncbi:MAG: PQQ-binding-like beta-propeller repeat protein [Sedimentisphaerales bacterium]|nr:PQQ-binding-like beta-propeller repeat protein [Sedimentisphaerales bacterium]